MVHTTCSLKDDLGKIGLRLTRRCSRATLLSLAVGVVQLLSVTSLSAECIVVSPGPGFHRDGMKLVLTAQAFDAGVSLPEKIRAEYGASARLADWQWLKSALSNQAVVQEFIVETGIPFQSAGGSCSNIFVSNAGSVLLDGQSAFFARHDGTDESRYFKIFDTIGDHSLDLGRWTYRSQALIEIPEDEERSQKPIVDLSLFSSFIIEALCVLVFTRLLWRRRFRRVTA